MKKLILFILTALLFSACQNDTTLIVGQLPEALTDFEEFTGKTVYFYPEAGIKAFFDEKRQKQHEFIKNQVAAEKKCGELERKIPVFNSMEVADAHNKAKELSKQCYDEYKAAQKNIDRMYFENLPAAEFTTEIKDDGSFAMRLPAGQKYALVLPDHAITWFNASGERKFLMISQGVHSPDDVVF